MSDAQAKKAVVELRGVRVDAAFPYDAAFAVEEFSLHAGDCAFVEVEREVRRAPMTDVVCGLCRPEEGTSHFEGADWATLSPDEEGRARSRIGRVFSGTGGDWLSNLDVDENVTLPVRYHGGPMDEERFARLEALAKLADCWPLPEGRHTTIPKNLLRRASWVRAFLADPVLVILEQPHWDITAAASVALAAVVAQARERGTAILWVAGQGDGWQDEHTRWTHRWQLAGGRLTQLESR